MFSKFCFSRFHGKFQLSQCCFSVFNFRRTTIKFLFLRFHCQIPIFTLPLSKFQFFTLLLARFNFYAYALKTFGGNNCLFSNWICLRNFGATCHQRFVATRGLGKSKPKISVKNWTSKQKLVFKLNLKPKSCVTAVVPSVFSHSNFHISIVGYASAPFLSRKQIKKFYKYVLRKYKFPILY